VFQLKTKQGAKARASRKACPVLRRVQGWNIKEVYHLEAVSGKSVMDHPETKRMLSHIKSGHISGIIFSKLARLAGTPGKLLDLPKYSESIMPTLFLFRNPSILRLRPAVSSNDDRRDGSVGTGRKLRNELQHPCLSEQNLVIIRRGRTVRISMGR